MSEFNPTEFRIYDRSTENVCDRLIIVHPFDWYIWAVRGELYIVNPEGGVKCSPNTTPAIKVYQDKFIETCITLNFNALVKSYTSKKPYIHKYEINSKTFTVLSALNILFDGFIKFDHEPETSKKIHHILEKNNENNENNNSNENLEVELEECIDIIDGDGGVINQTLKTHDKVDQKKPLFGVIKNTNHFYGGHANPTMKKRTRTIYEISNILKDNIGHI